MKYSSLFLYKVPPSVFLMLFMSNWVFSQNTLKINGGNLVASGNVHIVLNNTNFQNDGTFTQGTSTVHLKGNEPDAQSSIGGTNATTFYNLTVNKSANNAQLTQDITVTNDLTFTAGCLDIKNKTLNVTGNINYLATCFVKTSDVGVLKRSVGNTAVVFPVGINNITLLTLTNSGTADNFSVRVGNNVYANGLSGTIISSNVVNTTWYVTEEVTGGSTVNMTATWNGSNELTGFTRNNSYIQHYTSGAWQTTTGAAATGSNPYSISRNSITSFSPFAVASSGSPLPVELLSFTGKNTEGGNLLTWTTANETNNKGFDIERSNDGKTFGKLGWQDGQGNSKTPTSYTFIDNTPSVGLNYYRLKQWDFDGKYAFSKVIALNNDSKTALSVYPNPADEMLFVSTNQNKDMPYFLTNMLGQVVKTGVINTQATLDISSLISGTYFIKCNDVYVKFVKN
jgi:fibronectin-binding autotransporter adhesin